jgi:hypothetical protein
MKILDRPWRVGAALLLVQRATVHEIQKPAGYRAGAVPLLPTS